MKMLQTTIFLYKVKNPVFGEFYVQTDEEYPSPKTPERVIELYNNHFKESEYGKQHPEIFKETVCLDEAPMVTPILFSENQILDMI